MSEKNFSARSASSAPPKIEHISLDKSGHFTPDSIGKYSLAVPNLGNFKIQFCLHFAGQFCVSVHNRVAASRKLEQAMVAEWGAGEGIYQLLKCVPDGGCERLMSLAPRSQKSSSSVKNN